MIRWLLAAVLAAAPVTAMTQPRPGSIEARLQRVEDEIAISRIPIEYSRALDARDFAAYTALFAKNGEWVNGSLVRKGPEEIMKMLIGVYGPQQPGYVNRQSLEITTNIDVKVNGDHATARSQHLLIRRGPDGTPQPALAGRYEDELIREDGQWKILRRVDYPIMPTAEEWLAMMRARGAAK